MGMMPKIESLRKFSFKKPSFTLGSGYNEWLAHLWQNVQYIYLNPGQILYTKSFSNKCLTMSP